MNISIFVFEEFVELCVNFTRKIDSYFMQNVAQNLFFLLAPKYLRILHYVKIDL